MIWTTTVHHNVCWYVSWIQPVQINKISIAIIVTIISYQVPLLDLSIIKTIKQTRYWIKYFFLFDNGKLDGKIYNYHINEDTSRLVAPILCYFIICSPYINSLRHQFLLLAIISCLLASLERLNSKIKYGLKQWINPNINKGTTQRNTIPDKNREYE